MKTGKTKSKERKKRKKSKMKKSPPFFYNLPYESYEKKSSYEVKYVRNHYSGRENKYLHLRTKLGPIGFAFKLSNHYYMHLTTCIGIWLILLDI